MSVQEALRLAVQRAWLGKEMGGRSCCSVRFPQLRGKATARPYERFGPSLGRIAALGQH